jgi:hypothetical protein
MWGDINSASIPILSKNLKLKTQRGTINIYSGNTKQYKNFLNNLKSQIWEDSAADTVNELLNRL